MRRRAHPLGFAPTLFMVGVLAASHVASAAEPDRPIAYLAVANDFWQAFVMRADGSDPRQVSRSAYEKTHVAWFPDGRRLLLCGVDGRLREIDVGSGEERLIDLRLERVAGAVVSPDGARIAFSSVTAQGVDNDEIFTANVDGTAVTKHTSMSWLQHEPAWAPDGAALYFSSGDGKQSHDLWRLSLSSGAREQLTAGQLYHFEPSVAPDGRLAFSSNRTGSYEIWIQAPGEEPRALTHGPALDGAPAWSPDGASLVFHSTQTGSFQIWRVDLPEGVPVRLTQHDGGARDPAWWAPLREETP